MGWKEDIESLPKEITIQDCYERIYCWHKKHGKELIVIKGAYNKAYLGLLEALPLVKKATIDDQNFIFHEVLSDLMEWSTDKTDEYGIEIGDYAKLALVKQHYSTTMDKEFVKSRESSKLFSEFAPLRWRKKYGLE